MKPPEIRGALVQQQQGGARENWRANTTRCVPPRQFCSTLIGQFIQLEEVTVRLS